MRREGTWGSLGCRLVLVEYVSSSKYRCHKIFLNDEIITSPAAAIPFYASTLCHCNACPVHTLEYTKALHNALPTPYANMPLHIYNDSSLPHPLHPTLSTPSTSPPAPKHSFWASSYTSQRISPAQPTQPSPFLLGPSNQTPNPERKKKPHSRRIRLISRPRHRKIRSMLRYLPLPLARLQHRILCRWFVNHI